MFLPARRVSSPQLIGSPHRSTLDLNALQTHGVSLTGRLAGLRDGTLQFSGSLANHCALADLKMGRLLAGLDEFAESSGLYAIGLGFMRRRKSSFIHGAADDARELAAHLKAYLDRTANGRRRSAA